MQLYKPKNILVTGGAGFIGSHFILHLLRNHRNITITNVDLLTYAAIAENLSAIADDPRYQFVQANITDSETIAKLLREKSIDTIVHFAAESHVDRSISGPAPFIETNMVGTFQLLECAKRYWLGEKNYTAQQCRFHHISTDEVYGTLSKTAPAFTEQHPYEPNSPYSASKASSDHLVRAYYHTYGLPVTISNCSNNYGPHQHAEKLIPTVINACLKQQPIPVYGDGSNIRDWLYVVDHCQGIEQVIRQGQLGEKYNIGGEQEIANLDLVKMICQLMDECQPESAPHEQQIEFVTDRLGHDWRYAIDISKIKQQLHWHPQTALAQGLRHTIAYYVALLQES